MSIEQKAFAAFSVLTADDVNNYLMNQTVVQVTNQTELTSLSTSVMVAYVTSLGQVFQRTSGGWVALVGSSPWVLDLNSTTYNYALTSTANTVLPSTSVSVSVPAGRTIDVEFSVSQLSAVSAASAVVQLYAGSTLLDGALLTLGAGGGSNYQVKLTGNYQNTGTSAASVTLSAQGWVTSGGATLLASPYGFVRLRHRIF